MKPSKKLLAMLDSQKVRYKILEHRTAYTAFDLAATLHRPLKEVIKTILLRVDRGYALVALPADRRVDLKKAKKILKATSIAIAKESVQKKALKLLGNTAATPFALLYREIPLLVDRTLKKPSVIVAASGSFQHALLMSTKDFLRSTGAPIVDCSMNAPKKRKKARKLL